MNNNELTDDDYCWLYFALGHVAGGMLKDETADSGYFFRRTNEIKCKLEALQKKGQDNEPKHKIQIQ